MDDARATPQAGTLGCASVAVAVALAMWAALTWMGYSLWLDTKARVPDSPYLGGQWRYYVGVPLVATIVASVSIIALWRWRSLATSIILLSLILIVAVFAFLLPYSGGI